VRRVNRSRPTDFAAGTELTHPTRTDVLNWTYNWNLAPPIAVLPDEDGTIARRFAITETPTTFLIDQHGIINKRWRGFVLVAKLDVANPRARGSPARRALAPRMPESP
jgi:hypothetical protein